MSNEYLDWLHDLHDAPLHSEDHNHWLILMCPWLRLRDDEDEYKYTWLDSMPEGWYQAFGEDMCMELKEVIDEVDDPDWEYQILQIKEKFGELRWYTNGVPEEIYQRVDDIIEKYTLKSSHTCIYCGKPANWRARGWIEPLCEDCAKAQFESMRAPIGNHTLEDCFQRINDELHD